MVSHRFFGSFTLLVLLTVISSLWTYRAIWEIDKESRVTLDHVVPLNHATKDLRSGTSDIYSMVQSELFSNIKGDRDQLSELKKGISDAAQKIDLYTRQKFAITGNLHAVGLEENVTIFLKSTMELVDTLDASTGVGSESDVEFDALYDDLIRSVSSGSTRGEKSLDADFQRDMGQVQYFLAHGHLITAEILGGDFGEDFGEVLSSFEEARNIFLEHASSWRGEDDIEKRIGRLSQLAKHRYQVMMRHVKRNEGAIQSFETSYTRLHEIILEIDKDNKVLYDKSRQFLSRKTLDAKRFLIGLMVLSLFLAMCLCLYIFKSVLFPFRQLLNDVKSFIEQGVLLETPCLKRNDELGTLASVVEQLKINDGQKGELLTNMERAKLKADEANAAKSQFLANMSHEIRTPLNSIIGYADILAEDEMSHEQRNMAHLIKSSSDTLLTLVNDVLDLAKIESGEMTLEFVPINLESLIFEVMESQVSKTSMKRVELNVDMGDVYALVYSDPTRLKQVLMNIVGNAVKFTEEGQVIVCCEVLSEDVKQQSIRIIVKDTGIGMTEDQVEGIFDAFKQADGSTTRKYGGTGLGLNIAKKIVEAFGSSIRVKSVSGEGTEFSIDMDFKTHELDEDKHEMNYDRVLKDDHILIVDDNPSVHEIIGHYLNRSQLSYESAFSVDEGLEIMSRKKVSIVLLDIMMPKKDGFDFWDAMGESNKGVHVLAVTADIRSSTIARIKNRGFSGYIFKPVRRSALLMALAKIRGGGLRSSRASEDSSSASFEPKSILVADDNMMNLKVAKKALEKMGHRVTVVESGAESIQVTLRKDFDLIFMDMQMPEMSGVEATQRMRDLGVQIPIVALTANAFESDRQKCLEAGMTDFATKPLKREVLHQLIVKYTSHADGYLERRILLAGADDRAITELEEELADRFPGAIVKTCNSCHHLDVLMGSFAPQVVVLSEHLKNMNLKEWLSELGGHEALSNIHVYYVSEENIQMPSVELPHETKVEMVSGELSLNNEAILLMIEKEFDH